MGVVIEGWLVLPDRPDARRVVAGWPTLSREVVAHASGHPWLVGSLDRDELTLASVGSVRVAVIGSCPVTTTRLTDLVAGARTVAELDAVARVLPGCWHLVASIDGVVRVQGSLTSFLATRAGMPDLLTFRWAEADMANDDAAFAANALPQAEHVVVAQAEMPRIFADACDTGDTEAPYRFTRTLARTRTVLHSAGDAARPLAGDRGQHATLTILRTTGPAYRQLSRVYATVGLRLELPYLPRLTANVARRSATMSAVTPSGNRTRANVPSPSLRAGVR